MSLPLKIGLGFTGLAGVSGVVYLRFRQFSNNPAESFKSKYSLAVDGFLSDDATLDKKLNFLNGSSSSPKHSDLMDAQKHKKANKDSDAKTSFKKGCEDIYSKPIDSGFLEDFKSYCSFNNEDKIVTGKTLVTDVGDLANKQTDFINKAIDKLQKGFKNISKPTSGTADTAWQTSMLNECKGLAKDIFEGEILNFSEFCTK